MPNESQVNSETQSEKGNGAPEEPKYITKEQLDEHLKSFLQTGFNKAFSAREKALEAKLEAKLTDFGKSFAEQIGGALEEKLAALKPKEPEPEKGKGTKEAPPLKLEDLPEWKAHQKELEQLKKKAELAEQKAAEERKKSREAAKSSTLDKYLTEKGITGERLSIARGHLLNTARRISYAENDEGDDLVFKSDDGEELPIADGLAKWFKTKEAEFFLPPLNPKGSGGGPGGRIGGANQNMDDLLSAEFMRHAQGG